MLMSLRKNWLGYSVALCGVAGIDLLYKLVITDVNHTTVALSFLLVVLAVASVYGLGPAIVGSVLGVLCFNFFFLPPTGTMTIQDPQNWVALLAFLITAVTASQLSSAARDRAEDAEKRRAEVWKLYQLSRTIIATPDSETAVSSIARQVVEVFEFAYCAVFLPHGGQWRRIAMAGDDSTSIAQAEMENAFRSGEVGLSETQAGLTYSPLKIGVKAIGVMVCASPEVERGTVEAIAGLVALALERARFLKEVSHTEALRQSDELKSALLASVSHDLRTPLTAIRAAVDSLLEESISWEPGALREFHLIISEEVSRLTRLVQNLLEMARIEAGELKVSKRWEPVSEIINNVLLRSAAALRNHRVKVEPEDNQHVVNADSRLIAEALANLVENAARYSPAGTQIVIGGRVEGGELVICVSDQGPGVAPEEAGRVFDKFYRGARLAGKPSAGTGMGLSIAKGIVEAHGGRIWVDSQVGRGATFAFAIPVESKSFQASLLPAENV
jgi:two-component system, OmpR family, sensor histidine kinase KdpD